MSLYQFAYVNVYVSPFPFASPPFRCLMFFILKLVDAFYKVSFHCLVGLVMFAKYLLLSNIHIVGNKRAILYVVAKSKELMLSLLHQCWCRQTHKTHPDREKERERGICAASCQMVNEKRLAHFSAIVLTPNYTLRAFRFRPMKIAFFSLSKRFRSILCKWFKQQKQTAKKEEEKRKSPTNTIWSNTLTHI